jgi:hypothetical protein
MLQLQEFGRGAILHHFWALPKRNLGFSPREINNLGHPHWETARRRGRARQSRLFCANDNTPLPVAMK